jgi:RNA polymerase primary sigma factor
MGSDRPVTNGADDSSALAAYLREIARVPLLRPEQERELARRTRDGDPEARDLLVRSNLRLVVHVARGYRSRGVPLADLVAEGNLGLLRAVEAFDPAMNTPFAAYASFWIRQSIRRALVRMARSVRLPAHAARLLAAWRRTAARLCRELGRPPTDAEVAHSLRLPRRKAALVQRAMRVDSGQPRTGSDEEWCTLDAVIADGSGSAPGDDLEQREEVRRALEEVGRLPPRQAAVLRLRFGLGGGEPLNLRQIGEQLGLTRERVRQIEHEALGELARRRAGDPTATVSPR